MRLSIDDFGTGYSSLAYLSKLPFKQVKLDRVFIAEMPADPGSDAIVRATVELAHTFNATVVAEGVETLAQWEHLQTLGCSIAQGFFVGRPQPAADLMELLTQHPAGPFSSLPDGPVIRAYSCVTASSNVRSTLPEG